MNILLIGSGGREHALAEALKRAPSCKNLYIMPGNAGTVSCGMNVADLSHDFKSVEFFCSEKKIDLVVIGPEKPLAEGMADYLRNYGISVCGPGKAGAELESSKDFSKHFMQRHEIPTANYRSFSAREIHDALDYVKSHSLPVVVKASGLAAGKGVVICESNDDAVRVVKEMLSGDVFGEAGRIVVIEEFLKGIELSVFVVTDGDHFVLLPEAKDYKRIGEGDTGLNTGGMGAVSPLPFVNDILIEKIKKQIIEPTLAGLKTEAIEYRGFIFFGLILVDGEPFVIEYNCRMGDPETEVVFPRIQSDCALLLWDAANAKLKDKKLNIDPRSCATVMLVSGGYPNLFEKGKEISDYLPLNENQMAFHAATKSIDGKLLSAGGRVIASTGFGKNLQEALLNAYQLAEKTSFEGKYFRRDIGKDLM